MAKTYADRAKSIMNKYKSRLGDKFDKGDTLALEAMNQELSVLQQEQEETRALELGDMGGGLELPEHTFGGMLANAAIPLLSNYHNTFLKGKDFGITEGKTSFGGYKDAVTPKLSTDLKNVGLVPGKVPSSESEGTPYKSRVPWMGMASGIIGNMLMNQKVDLPTYKHENYDPALVSPNLVNFSRERENISRERDLANNMIMNSARGAGSQNALMENTLAGVTGTQRAAGAQIGESYEKEGTTNASILNDTSKFNAQLKSDANRQNMQGLLYQNQGERENSMIEAERKDSRIRGIMDSVTGYAKDRMRADQYDTMLHMSAPENTAWEIGEGDTKLKKFLQFNAPIKRTFVNTNDKTSDKEKGGYLTGSIKLFGDDEYERLMLRTRKTANKK